jgi:hypothetical protein
MSYKTSDMNRKPYYYLLAALMIIGLAISCKKGDDTLPAAPRATRLNVINTSSQTINFYVNGSRQNTAAIVPGGYTGYTNVPVGEQQYAFKPAFDRNNYATADTLFTLPVKLDTAQVYSFFVSGATRSSVIVARDIINGNVPPGKALVRFVQASADLPSLRVVMNDTLQYSNSAYKSVSDFKPLNVGEKVIQIYTENGNTPLFSITQTLTSRYYTLFVQGKLNPSRADEAIKATLLQN